MYAFYGGFFTKSGMNNSYEIRLNSYFCQNSRNFRINLHYRAAISRRQILSHQLWNKVS